MGFFTTAAIIGATAASIGTSVSAANSQKKSAKGAAEEAARQNNAAIQSVKDAQGIASSQATESIRRRTNAMSQTVYTSPLGLGTQASTAKKALLGQ